MAEPSPELDLLRAAMRWHLGRDGIADDFPTLLADIDWQRVLWLGRQEGALLFLYEALKVLRLQEQCPQKLLTQLETLRQVNQLRSFGRGRELCLLQDLFDRLGVRALSVDRWLLAQNSGISPERVELGVNLRYIVPAEQLASATDALRAIGHRTESDPQKLVKKDHSPVLLSSNIAPASTSARIWFGARMVTVGGRSLHCLSPLHWIFQRAALYGPGLTSSLFRAWEIVSLARQVHDTEWVHAAAEADEVGLSESWEEPVAACFDILHVPRPVALAQVLAKCSLLADAGLSEVDRTPFLPTPSAVARRMLELVGAGPSDLVCDLGCGDGRLVISAAKDFGARGLGVDLDPIRIAEATERAVGQKVNERVTFVCGDLLEQDLSEVTVLCLYLLPGFYPRIRRKIECEARPGMRIVSHNYVFQGWPPKDTEIVRTGLFSVSQIYVWRLP